MRTVVTTLAITLVLGVGAWLTTKDSRRPERVQRDVPTIVAPEGRSATVTTPSVLTTAPPYKPATPTTVPTDQFKTSPVPPHKPAAPKVQPNPAVQKWLVGELVHEGLSDLDSERIVRATVAKIAECIKLYGQFPERPTRQNCVLNAIQESGMLEAFRRLAAAKKAADAAYRPPPDQAPHPPAPPVPDAASRR